MQATADATTAPTMPLYLALLGNPNCGKTALFNLLTGTRQKVANYAGVTVERKEGWVQTAGGRRVRVLDLPGTYSLNAHSLDETVTRDVVTGQHPSEAPPQLLVCVTDATHLRLNLRLVLEARQLGLPMLLVLNMNDMAQRQGIHIDRQILARELGIPVVSTVGVRTDGARELLQWLDTHHIPVPTTAPIPTAALAPRNHSAHAPALEQHLQYVQQLHEEVVRLMGLAVREPVHSLRRDDRIDAVVLHPVWGMLILAMTLFLMFQAVFSWAEAPMGWIEGATAASTEWLNLHMTAGPLRSLLADGAIAGAGGVLVFLPQILILFFFILALEDSGYLPRAAFMLDRVMGLVGLSGRSFIPLLSSFACAVPGIMATRSIPDWRDRLVTILIAPLMTCSARLPVYALLIAAFIPQQTVGGWFNLQGLVLFALYCGGIASAMAIAALAQRLSRSASGTSGTAGVPTTNGAAPLLMELPSYRWPSARNLGLGLWERAMIFLRRVGGIILAVTIVLWFLSSYPALPEGATGTAIEYSYAGQLGAVLAMLFAPIGFNWQISIALVPGMAAREVVVGALGTVYALSATGDEAAQQLSTLIGGSWSLATALSLLVWFVFAPQCISTIAAVRRETNSWRWACIMVAYLFALAYAASFITYRLALAWTHAS